MATRKPTTTRRRKGTSFAVDLSGLELPADITDRIAKAIQRTVLTEIAALDLGPEYAVNLLPGADSAGSRAFQAGGGGLGTTQGIIVQFGATS